MARPANVPITRLRFRGRTRTLNAVCDVFRQHPNQSLTAAAVAEFGELDFRDVYMRLSETPELFIHLKKRKNEPLRYRLTSAVAKMTTEETAALIDQQVRSETRLVVVVIAIFMLLATLIGVLSRFD
jgi:hypothetical protein